MTIRVSITCSFLWFSYAGRETVYTSSLIYITKGGIPLVQKQLSNILAQYLVLDIF